MRPAESGTPAARQKVSFRTSRESGRTRRSHDCPWLTLHANAPAIETSSEAIEASFGSLTLNHAT